jgi:hypothetical protein
VAASLIEIARAHRLRHGRLEDGEVVIPGKRGFVYLDGHRLRWCLIREEPFDGFRGATLKNRALRDPMFEVLLEGDEEAVFAFDEEHLDEVAARWCRCRRRRVLAPEHRQAVVARGRENLRRLREVKAQGRQTDPEPPIPSVGDPEVALAMPGRSGAENRAAPWT